MPIEVQLPDGSIGEFPDGMPNTEIEAVLQKQFPSESAAPESKPAEGEGLQTAGEKSIVDANEKRGFWANMIKGAPRGAEEGTLGIMQALGLEKPLMKLAAHVMPGVEAADIEAMPDKDIQQSSYDLAHDLRVKGKGTGVGGSIGEFAGDPRTWATMATMPFGAGANATGGGIYGYTDMAENDKENSAGNRATGAGEGAALSVVAPWVMSKAGGFVAGKAADAYNAVVPDGAVGGLIDKYMPGALSRAKNTSNEPWKDTLEDASKGTFFKKTPNQINVGEKGIKDISENYGKDLAKANVGYAKQESIGAGKFVDDKGVRDVMDNLIETLAATPGSDQKGAAIALKNMRTALDTGVPTKLNPITGQFEPQPVVGLNSLVDLEKASNQFLGQGGTSDAGDAAIKQFKGAIQSKIDSLKATHPDFVKQVDANRSFYKHNIALKYHDNAELKPLWSKDDYYGQKAIDDFAAKKSAHEAAIQNVKNLAAQKAPSAQMTAAIKDMLDKDISHLTPPSIHPETTSRANTFLQNLNTDKSGRLQALVRALDMNPESAQELLKSAYTSAGRSDTSLTQAARKLITGHPVMAAETAVRSFLPKAENNKIGGLVDNLRGESGIESFIRGSGGKGTPAAVRVLEKAYDNPNKIDNYTTDGIYPDADGKLMLEDKGKFPATPIPEAIAPVEETPPPATDDSDLLKKISMIESGGNPTAKNPQGTSRGLYGFTDGTWRNMVKNYGKEYGVKLSDRGNPQAEAVMAALLAQENRKTLSQTLGRDPTEGELYAAHFLGADGAKKLLASQNVERTAASLLPEAASSNQKIFFEKGQPISTKQLLAKLTDKMARA